MASLLNYELRLSANMDSMDFIWGELQRAIETKILEEQEHDSSDTRHVQSQDTIKEEELPPGETPSS